MRGSSSGSPPEEALSRAAQAVTEVERLERVRRRVGEGREPSIHPVELLGLGPLMCPFGTQPAALQRLAGELEHAVAPAALGLLEPLHVDLGGEHLVRAAHVARAAQWIVIRVQRRALLLNARRGSDHAVAIREALPALGGLRTADCPAHLRESTRPE